MRQSEQLIIWKRLFWSHLWVECDFNLTGLLAPKHLVVHLQGEHSCSYWSLCFYLHYPFQNSTTKTMPSHSRVAKLRSYKVLYNLVPTQLLPAQQRTSVTLTWSQSGRYVPTSLFVVISGVGPNEAFHKKSYFTP